MCFKTMTNEKSSTISLTLSNINTILFLHKITLRCCILGRGSYLFNGALIKPGWVLTVANVLPGASKLQVVLGTSRVSAILRTSSS